MSAGMILRAVKPPAASGDRQLGCWSGHFAARSTKRFCGEFCSAALGKCQSFQQDIENKGKKSLMVRPRGLEPPRVAPLAPQASATTYSATTADGVSAGRAV